MKKNVLITGANGFIGKNLSIRLQEEGDLNIIKLLRNQSIDNIDIPLKDIDFIFHLAGENRPEKLEDFETNNYNLTSTLCEKLSSLDKNIPIVFSSSSQAKLDNPYGKSKKKAEDKIIEYSKELNRIIIIYRLPGVFGKWCKPNYNSVVATFCYNISRGVPIKISDPKRSLELVYIDDLISSFLDDFKDPRSKPHFKSISPTYILSLKDLSKKLLKIHEKRNELFIEDTGEGIDRALYSTFISYLPNEDFCYEIPKYEDHRGSFVEMLKTKKNGQVSFFTIKPGATRGSHYHHSKTEKFLVAIGEIKMNFRNKISGEKQEIFLSSDKPKIVDTIPGWVHDITNIGSQTAVVMLWANEIFDKKTPDTYFEEV